MTRFQTITEKHGDVLVYVLRDLENGAGARIVPARGANCLELKLAPEPGAAPVAVINDMPHLDKLKTSFSRHGIPILFPWPSGIPDGVFAFEGKRIDLNGPESNGPTHHGFVNNAPWQVVRSDCDNTGAWVTCAVASADCPSPLARRFPFSFTLQATWKLSERGFTMEFEAKNTGDKTMPMGLGLHPYFTLPFSKEGTRQKCKLAVDAARQWDLDAIMKGKPGEPPVTNPYLPAMKFDTSAKDGRPLGDVAFNEVLEASFDGGHTTASITDPASGLRMSVTAGGDFKSWVIYSPSDRSAISLEPWTMVPNAFNLAAAGQPGSGMIQLKPGSSWRGTVGFTLRRVQMPSA